jgi:DNA-binding helix-hairpin-helix protein with protein kinase domain
MPSYSDTRGQSLRLGAKIGGGNEGNVFDVVGRPELAAKIYHKPLSAERAQKIAAMPTIVTPALQKMTAWPADLVVADARTPIGLLMPKAQGFKDIHKLYSPKSRKTEFPEADFRFLVHAAANISRAFATVHDANCVIGDVNHGGVTVAANATVKLIDCDSFQVSASGKTFLCEVGVPTFTPPELQGRPFRGVVRSPNHDNFGLAVLIFHLLFIGRHPFAGRFLGLGDMSIEGAIQQFRFAYGVNSKQTLMEPPPNVPALATVSPSVASLFERAFSRAASNGSARPTASEWITALEELGQQLVKCKTNQSHTYSSSTGACPWCQVEAATGLVLFNLIVLPTTQPHLFDIVTVWRTIDAVRLSNVPSPPREEDFTPLPPSPPAIKAARERRTHIGRRWIHAFGLVIGVLVLCGIAPNLVVLWIGGAAWGVYTVVTRRPSPKTVTAFNSALLSAESRHRTALDRYIWFNHPNVGAASAFWRKKKELAALRDEWNSLPALRAQRLRQLEKDRRRHQLEAFLSNFFIDHAAIAGIGPGRKATLASYGIETAADVEKNKVLAVPGFGPTMTDKLLEWRRAIERNFRFDPARGVDPHLIITIDQELATNKRKVEQALMIGATALMQAKHQVDQQQALLRRELEEATKSLVQARVDQRAASA